MVYKKEAFISFFLILSFFAWAQDFQDRRFYDRIGHFEFMNRGSIEDGITGTLILPEGILGIEAGAFARNSIDRVVLPESLEFIESGAFHGNPVREIVIGHNVNIGWSQTPGSGAGPALGRFGASFFIVYHYNDKSGGEYIFNETEQFWYFNGGRIVFSPREMIIPSGIYELGGSEHQWRMITNLYLPDGIIKLLDLVFVGNNLNEIRIPESVRFIGSGAFGRNPITKIRIGDNVEFMEDDIYPTFGRFSWSFQRAYIENHRRAGTYIFNQDNNEWDFME